MPKRHVVVLALALASPACKPSSESDSPAPGPGVSVEREPTRGPTQISAEFVYVSGVGSGPFSDAVDKGQPAIITAILPDNEWPDPLRLEIARQINLEEFYEGADATVLAIEPSAIVAAGFEPVHRAIWLIGPDGPCAARLGEPRVSIYAPAWPILEVSWLLEGCTIADPNAWAPIALVSDTPPPAELRWRPATWLHKDEPVDPNTWDSPYAPLLRAYIDELGKPSDDWPEGYVADEWFMRDATVPGTDVVQVDFAGVRRHRPEPGEEYEECMDNELTRTLAGQWLNGAIVGTGTPTDQSHDLVGAFVVGDEAVLTVHELWGQALVGTVASELPATEVGVAAFHPEDSFGWSVIAYCGP